MKPAYILLLIIFSFFNSFSQSNYPAFGKADLNELLLKDCPFEKGANAMKLMDYQETEIDMDNAARIETNRRVRIKIFNKAGFKASNIIIPYLKANKTSKITDITAYIYNLDSSGKIITQKLEKKQILRDKSEQGIINTVAFTFPNVRPGSVIEYRFTYSARNIIHLTPWFFQDLIPTAASICKFTYPQNVKFDFRLVTTDSVISDFSTNNIKDTRYFISRNIHSFNPEPMMSSVKDNLQRVEFALLSRGRFIDFGSNEGRWGFYCRALMNYYLGPQIAIQIPGTESIIDSVKKLTTKEDQINYIFQSVKKNMNWDQNQTFYPDDIKEAWQVKLGNSAEINLTILNLLRKAEIESYPILISTRDNGKTDPDFVSLGQFDGLDVLILDSSRFYLIDGTQKYSSFKTTPFNVLNRAAFLMDSMEHKWVNIVDDRPLMKINIAVKAKVNSDAQLKGEAHITLYEHSKARELEERARKKTDEEKQQDNKEFIQRDFENIIIDTIVQENENDELLPLAEKFNFTYKLTSTGDYFILDPFFISSFRKNPFSDSIRRSDIDMGSNQSYSLYLHITIPDEYLVEELPKNILIRSGDSSILFKREIYRDGGIIVFRNSFDIQRTIYSKEEYFGIKEFFRKIYDTIDDRIVLKKKE